MKNNLILIGMPAAGKSTLGVLLAKRLALDFIDTDLLLQRRMGLRLHQMINLKGLHSFRAAEEQTLLTLDCQQAVIATGGSVIYSPAGMAHLAQLGRILYLEISLEQLARRLDDCGQRGVVMAPGQSLADLYAERTPLYRRYAEVMISCDGREMTQIIDEIVAQLDSHPLHEDDR
ncbi:MAG: shikimate kinase [Deltaproteobacteria bacterium]|nr:shikimate kinase [Deltaproteobacteria bacterium]NCP01835.1 shikimate kinase [Deltaproteobacteria bacterium]